jgi:hypothetical protein
MADAWIKKVALEIGLRDGKLCSALAYAGMEDWLADNHKEGWTSLTSAGEASVPRTPSKTSPTASPEPTKTLSQPPKNGSQS